MLNDRGDIFGRGAVLAADDPEHVEKLGHVAGVAVLYSQGRLSVADATAAGPDLLLAVLFIVAFTMTRKFVLTGSSSQPAGR